MMLQAGIAVIIISSSSSSFSDAGEKKEQKWSEDTISPSLFPSSLADTCRLRQQTMLGEFLGLFFFSCSVFCSLFKQ